MADTKTAMFVSELTDILERTRWLHAGDAVVLCIYDEATKTNKLYRLISVEHDPRDPSVGIPTGALYLCASTTDEESE